MRTILTMLFLFSLSSCVHSDAIYLAHKQTGEKVQCGPYLVRGNNGDIATAQRESQCISDYQRQGYERIAVPTK